MSGTVSATLYAEKCSEPIHTEIIHLLHDKRDSFHCLRIGGLSVYADLQQLRDLGMLIDAYLTEYEKEDRDLRVQVKVSGTI